MKLVLQNPKIFTDIVTIISELVVEVRLKVKPEGLSLTAFDPATVAMVHFKLPASLFSTFEVEKEEVLGVNLNNLKAVLRRCRPGTTLSFAREDNVLKITLQDKLRRDFGLALIEINSEDKEVPQWEFDSVIKMNSEMFSEVIEDCSIVSDVCTLIAEPDRFIVEAKGLNSARTEFTSDEVEIHSGSSMARYSLEYINKFIKGSKISPKVTISFSSKAPLKVDFSTGEVLLSFALAPRVE
ncbi:proliferating cell nuclear antigen (pcna) [Candidatus Pacearchaeota archaeon]|nr:MAG: proliferating cell nuclear antigen (pcna) [Candidatus Pacearchaeota archaeon]